MNMDIKSSIIDINKKPRYYNLGCSQMEQATGIEPA